MNSFSVTRSGHRPHQIQALGIVFQPTHRQILVWAFFCVVLYFLVAFIVYAFADWFGRVADKVQHEEDLGVAAMGDSRGGRPMARQHANQRVPIFGRLQGRARKVAYFRFAVDFVLPVVLALIALWCLYVLATRPLPTYLFVGSGAMGLGGGRLGWA
jgi:hypothetical protein